MRIAFYYNALGGYEHLGIESLSAVLKAAGHQVMLAMDTSDSLDDILKSKLQLNLFSRRDRQHELLIQKITNFKPDVICFSVISENYASSIHFAKILKTTLGSEIINIFGGIHVTSVPEVVIRNPFVDFAMIGEGEVSLLELIDALEGRTTFENVSNLVYKNNGVVKKNNLAPYIRDLDTLPLPDKDIFYEKIPALKNDYYIFTGRGCPYTCTFCCNSLYHSMYDSERNHIRRRSIDHVIRELVIAKEKYKPKLISFLDEVFVLRRKEWLYPFLEEYSKKINLPYYCQLHPENIDHELARRLAQSNCWNVTLGVQSGSQRIRKEFYNRNTSNSMLIESCKTLKNEKLFVTVDIILGCPTEENKDLDLTLEIMEQIIPSKIASFFMAYYPGTDLTKKAVELGYLPLETAEAYKEGAYESTHYALNLPGEFALPLDKRKYWICQLKMQIVCILRNTRLAHLTYWFIDRMPSRILSVLSKLITIFASLKNFDKRGFQRLRLLFGKRQVP